MWRIRKAVASICGALIVCPTVAGRDGLEARHLLSDLGPGADIKLKLVDGSKRRGRVESIGSEGFVLKSAPASAGQSIDYGLVADLDLVQRVYWSRSERDPVEARRVAVALGLEHHVLARVRSD